MITVILFIALSRLFTDEADWLYFKLYLVGFAMVLLLNGAIYEIAMRASIYFSICQIYLLAIPTRRLGRPVLRNVYCMVLIALSLSRLFTGVYLRHPRIFVPYKGVIINRDVVRDLGWFKNDL